MEHFPSPDENILTYERRTKREIEKLRVKIGERERERESDKKGGRERKKIE